MAQPPFAIGLLVCDQAIVEEGTHNVTLVNCFTRFRVESFPSESKPFAAFAALTDGFGKVTMTVIIRLLEGDREVYQQTRLVHFTDRLQQVRFLFRITRCPFPMPGVYEISLLADGEPLAGQRFHVEKLEAQP